MPQRKVIHAGWTPPGLTRAGVDFPHLLRHNADFDSQYALKLSAIRNEQPQTLNPGEFLRYVLLHSDGLNTSEEEAIALETFEKKIGKQQGFLMANVFDRGCWLYNQLIDQLAIMSNRDVNFWRKSEFTSSEAKGITFDFTKDLQHINRHYAKRDARLRAQRHH